MNEMEPNDTKDTKPMMLSDCILSVSKDRKPDSQEKCDYQTFLSRLLRENKLSPPTEAPLQPLDPTSESESSISSDIKAIQSELLQTTFDKASVTKYPPTAPNHGYHSREAVLDMIRKIKGELQKSLMSTEALETAMSQLRYEKYFLNLAEDLTCSICREVMYRPVSLDTCHHTFCLLCIVKAIMEGYIQCPECRGEFQHWIPNHLIGKLAETWLKACPETYVCEEEERRKTTVSEKLSAVLNNSIMVPLH
ncbi:hypothetical protein RUND412_004205 [Rhizina undulata]